MLAGTIQRSDVLPVIHPAPSPIPIRLRELLVGVVPPAMVIRNPVFTAVVGDEASRADQEQDAEEDQQRGYYPDVLALVDDLIVVGLLHADIVKRVTEVSQALG